MDVVIERLERWKMSLEHDLEKDAERLEAITKERDQIVENIAFGKQDLARIDIAIEKLNKG